ncbi:MAG TPA: phage holin family protein [Microbacteriaceae bacterium]|nr:phage holin family protein [Microbacteriaceae bacterium]
MRNLARILVTALALWITTLIVGGPGEKGIWVQQTGDDTLGLIFTFVVVALIFALVNMTLGTVVRIVSIPLRILTLGLFSLVINALMLLLVGWISGLIGFGLQVDGFWWAVLGAIILSISTTLLSAILGVRKK